MADRLIDRDKVNSFTFYRSHYDPDTNHCYVDTLNKADERHLFDGQTGTPLAIAQQHLGERGYGLIWVKEFRIKNDDTSFEEATAFIDKRMMEDSLDGLANKFLEGKKP